MKVDVRKVGGPQGQAQPTAVAAKPLEALRWPDLGALPKTGLRAASPATKADLSSAFNTLIRRTSIAVGAAIIGASALLLGPGAPIEQVAAPPQQILAPAERAGPTLPVVPVEGLALQAEGPAVQKEGLAITPAKMAPSSQIRARAELETVRSLSTEHAGLALRAAHRKLGESSAERMRAIGALLKQMQSNGSSAAMISKVQDDLHRPLDEVATIKDSRMVFGGLQRDVSKWFGETAKREQELHATMQAWSRLDEAYLSPQVAETLAPLGLSPADLKALVGQESGDHMLKDQRGDIAGIAQIGTRENREVGPHLDRKDDKQAIELAALVLSKKADQLEAMARYRGVDWDAVQASPNFSRLLFASYNAGAEPIARALKIAQSEGLDITSWAAIRGAPGAHDNAPLHRGLAATKTYRGKAAAKAKEVRTYVQRIDLRRAEPPSTPLNDA
jgi:hypothetical protein